MSESVTIRLDGPDERDRACDMVRIAPKGHVVTIKAKKRTVDQNAIFHAICSDCEKSGVEYGGRPRQAWEWKWLFTCGWAVATGKKFELLLGLEGERLMMRPSTSEMSVSELSEVVDYAKSECAKRGIHLQERT